MTTMNTPQITPTPDAVKLARALATDICVGHIAEARDWEKTRDTIAALILPVLTAQQAEHAATVSRLERERDELRGKADACWGAANYRLKYIGCLFRAAGLDDSDPMEKRIGAAAEHIEKLVADLSAARAEVERWKRDKDDAEERLIPLIELVEKHTLESEDSFDTEDVLEGHYKDRAQFRAQLTALRERAEGLAGALGTIVKGHGCYVFLDGRNEHGTHILPTQLGGLDWLDLEKIELENDPAFTENVFQEAEYDGFKTGDCVWLDWRRDEGQMGDEGRWEIEPYWEYAGVNVQLSRALAAYRAATDSARKEGK